MKEIIYENEPNVGGADEAVISRLAKLSIFEYERVRKQEAKNLGVREWILDQLVAAQRPKKVADVDSLQGSEVNLTPVEPWPEAVNGAEVLNEIASIFRKYVVLTDEQADVLALWCGHTHVFEAFICSPRLNISSPDKGCGKTTLRDVVGLFVSKPLFAENLTPATQFRLVAKYTPTILADEYDAWVKNNEELRGLLNAGYRRGGAVCRCEGDSNTVRQFPAFAPVVLCGIGRLPDTIQDRSIQIRLKRAMRVELPTRFDPRRVEIETQLCRKLARWCKDNYERLQSSDPKMPAAAYNRVADNWRPLFAIAESIGSEWLSRCESAFTKLTSGNDEENLSIQLLSDIRDILNGYAEQRISSRKLVEALCNLEDRPWVGLHWGKAITTNWLAKRLTSFDVHPKTLRIKADERAKGYEISDFKEVFDRYLANEGQIKRDNVTSDKNPLSEKVTSTSSVTDIDSMTRDVDHEDSSLCHGLPTNAEPVGDLFNDEAEEDEALIEEWEKEGLL